MWVGEGGGGLWCAGQLAVITFEEGSERGGGGGLSLISRPCLPISPLLSALLPFLLLLRLFLAGCEALSRQKIRSIGSKQVQNKTRCSSAFWGKKRTLDTCSCKNFVNISQAILHNTMKAVWTSIFGTFYCKAKFCVFGIGHENDRTKSNWLI